MAHEQGCSRRRFLAAGAGLTTTALAGCLGSRDDGLPDSAEVVMRTTPYPEFDPDIAHVGVGGTVVWTLESGTHDTVSYHPDTYPPLRMPADATPWRSEKLRSVGETFERRFDQPGVYDYVDTEAVCISHEVAGNVARVVVGWPDPDPETQPALRPPQERLPPVARSRITDLNERTRELLESDPTQ